MNKLFLSLLVLITFSASAQVPSWVPAQPDSVKIGVLRNGVVNQVKMGDLMRFRVSTDKYTTDSLRNEAVYFHYKEGLISGGIVTLNSGMTLDVTEAVYSINNVIHYTTAGQITLNASDATFPRKDIVAVNNLNQIVKITGTPSANPIEPQIDPLTQVKLTVLDIAAGATSPTITSNVVYDENIEWTVSTGGTITANANSTTRAIRGTKSILVSSFSSGAYISLKTGTAVNVTAMSAIKFYLYLTANWGNSNSLTMQLFKSGASVSNPVAVTVNKTATASWQNLVQNAFRFTGSSFDEVRLIFAGTSASPLSIDYVEIQGGITSNNANNITEVDPLFSANGATKTALSDTAANLRAAIGSGGSTGVTSVAKGYGMKQDGTITTTGTVAVDSNVVASTARANKIKDSLQANINANTTAISNNTSSISTLQSTSTNYLPKSDSTLANRITANTTAINTNTSNIASNTAAIATKADKATTITINGETHDLSTSRTFTVTGGGGSTSDTLSAFREVLNAAKYTSDTILFLGDSKTVSSLLPAYQSQNSWVKAVSSNFSKGFINNAAASSTIYDTAAGNNLFSQMGTSIPNKRTGITALFFYYYHNDAAASATAARFISTYRRIMDTCIIKRGYSASELNIIIANDPNVSATLVKAYRDSLTVMCKQYGIKLYDLYDQMTNANLMGNNLWVDGTHENIFGHNMISNYVIPRFVYYNLKDSSGYASIVANGVVDATKIRMRLGDSTFSGEMQNSSLVGVNRLGKLFPINNSTYVLNTSLDSTASPNSINISGNMRATILAATGSPYFVRNYSTAKAGLYMGFMGTSAGGYLAAENGLGGTFYPLHIGHNSSPTIFGDMLASNNSDVVQVQGGIYTTKLGIGAVSSANSSLEITRSGIVPMPSYTGLKINIVKTTLRDGTHGTGGTYPFLTINALSSDSITTPVSGVVYSKAATLYIEGAPAASFGSGITLTNPYALYIENGKSYFGGPVVLNTATEPATPAAGTVVEWWDGTNKKWKKSDGSTGIIY